MSAINEALGTPHEFQHKGKTYHVSLITQAVKAGFEKRLFAKSKEAASTMRELMDKPDYLAHLKSLNDDYIAGEYAFESQRGLSAVKTVQGFVVLMSLLMGIDETEVLAIITERGDELQLLVRMIFLESFPGMEEEMKKQEEEAKAEGKGEGKN
jgi:hypothetical protein